jgi:eukaryotic-like serine/threonine-protein kinase
MAEDSPLALSNALIAGRFAVDVSQVLPDAGAGIPAYLARDRMASDGKRVALAVSRDASPDSRALRILTDPIDNLMTPLGHGTASLGAGKGEGYFVVCTPPPGPAVAAALNSWPDRALTDLVLLPIARVLDAMHARKLTHRAIRSNNVFQSARGQPVTLGAAWAAPPAMHQPAVFESPYTAMCHPAARGPGTIADDVYALGVLLLTLSTGVVPMANMDDATIIRWKIELGSFAALTRARPVSGLFADLLHSMLADDPDHRPLPVQLLDPGSLRGRRAAARPPRRSQNPLMLNDIAVFDARMLAYALLLDQRKAVQFLANGLVTQWLRRGLGDASLATQVEDLVRGRSTDTRSGPLCDPLLVMHTISTISARMPLCWRGIALWPDGLTGLLAQGIAGEPDLLAAVEELLVNDAATVWVRAGARPDRPEPPDISAIITQPGGSNGMVRLFYELNPLLPCRAPGMGAAWVAGMPALMRSLEQAAGSAGGALLGQHLFAFIAARADRKSEMQVDKLAGAKTDDSFRLGELALLRDLQLRYHPEPMVALAKWAASRLRQDLEVWHNKPRRLAMQARLESLVQAGLLARLLELTGDQAARALDIAGATRAANEIKAIDAEVAAINTEDRRRFGDAERFGHAITGGIGLSALILMAMSVLLR